MSCSLLHIQDHRGRFLSLQESGKLIFSAEGDSFGLAVLGRSSFCLSHGRSGQWIGVKEGEIGLSRTPAVLEFFTDLEKCVALRLTTGAFLASHRYSGDLIALNGPIRKDRDLKLFSLREIAAPSYALDYWPVRCHLKTQDGLYLSNTARKLATNAEVHCCSEELILDLSGDVTIAGNSALTQSCLWSSNATYLASMEASTSQLLFQSQHSCFGRETFGVQLFSGGNELALTQQVINDGETEAGVVCKWPSVRCSPGAKPTRLTLEIASKPVFLITAHGGFAAASDSRPASATVCTLPRQTINPSADALTLASWQFEHRGDNLYTIQHLGTKNPLYVGHAGTLRMDGNHPPFPDSRLLFNVQLTWTKSDGVCKKEGGESAEQSIAGFAIKSLFKLNGKQLYLSALPDGRIATCYSKSHPSRWELFGVADREAVLNSGARPLSRLPLHPVTTPPAEPAMRRSSSCNAIPGNSGSSLLSTSPPSTLPGILENFDEESSSCTEEEEEELTETMAAQLSALLPTTSGALLRERRCASESALTQLQTCGKVEEPKWLADLRRIPARPSGWDVRSGATMQEQSCQSLCSEALRNAGENPEESPTNNVEAAGPLPEEVKSRVVNKLQEITATPEPAKLSYPHLAKAAAHGTAPEWSQSLLVHDVQEETLPEELTESYVCTACHGSSGLLLPLDPEINPRHHRFLQAMERRQFGRVRRRNGRGPPDAVVAGLQVVKNGLVFFGVFKVLTALMK